MSRKTELRPRSVCSDLLGPACRENAVALGSLVAGIHRIPPTAAARCKFLNRNHGPVRAPYFKFIKPNAQIKVTRWPSTGRLKNRDGVRKPMGTGLPIQAEPLRPLGQLLLVYVEELPPVDWLAAETLDNTKQFLQCERDN